jgi:hypothetical protein
MNELVRSLEELLHHERRLALKADLEGIEKVQEEKRVVLDRLREEADEEAMAEVRRLGAFAQENLGLLRQLLAMLRALAGVGTATYGANGREVLDSPAAERGVL